MRQWMWTDAAVSADLSLSYDFPQCLMLRKVYPWHPPSWPSFIMIHSLFKSSCYIHVNIYIKITFELCRALSNLFLSQGGKHNLHYNDTVDIFPMIVIVAQSLPVIIFGFISWNNPELWWNSSIGKEVKTWKGVNACIGEMAQLNSASIFSEFSV